MKSSLPDLPTATLLPHLWIFLYKSLVMPNSDLLQKNLLFLKPHSVSLLSICWLYKWIVSEEISRMVDYPNLSMVNN